MSPLGYVSLGAMMHTQDTKFECPDIQCISVKPLSGLEFGTQTLPVRSLDTDTKAPSGKAADASPLTSISWPGMEHLSLYELADAILPR